MIELFLMYIYFILQEMLKFVPPPPICIILLVLALHFSHGTSFDIEHMEVCAISNASLIVGGPCCEHVSPSGSSVILVCHSITFT